MSINDPILKALTFSLGNDLTFEPPPQLPSSSKNTGESSNSSKAVESDSRTNDSFTPSSVLLEEDQRTFCLAPKCMHVFNENICRNGSAQQEALAHLLKEHKMVIENPNEIANLSKYLVYWRERLKSASVTEICVGFATDELGKTPTPNKSRSGISKEPKEANKNDIAQNDGLYYMFSPDLPEDSELRKQLWRKRLDIVLEVNRLEREETTFCRRCLFCREIVNGNRSQCFVHMRDSHSFHIGQPDNLVFVKELLQLLEDKLNRLECLFCEHVYKDKVVLKEHMRKKQHRKISPHNSEYDRFYVVNYLEPGKTWENIGLEDGEDETREEEWVEPSEEKQRNVVCLFCTASDSSYQNVLDHMNTEHLFDFLQITESLDFYHKVKLVNYIRRTVYQISCFICDDRFQDGSLLLSHISEHNINGSLELLPSQEKWNQAEYFFPTYENDEFLTYLDGDNENFDCTSSSDGEGHVIAEDLPSSMTTTSRDFDLAGLAIRYHNEFKSTK
ncbi:unnamed protein product [Orchesella dallaii]|uniref:C2H2-type domain-containing protein n=1 Tax=Orchesella dallaii TaxID=48710 RepID=A0ABP1PYS9_9HEXA